MLSYTLINPNELHAIKIIALTVIICTHSPYGFGSMHISYNINDENIWEEKLS